MLMNEIYYFALVSLSILSAAIFIIWQDKKHPLLSLALKSLSSLLFTILGIFCVLVQSLWIAGAFFIVIGLMTSILGDVFLGLLEFKEEKNENIIILGMIAFSLAQVFYWFGLNFAINFKMFYISLLCSVIIALAILFGEKLLKLNYGKCKIFVGIYSFFLAASLVQSLLVAIMSNFNLFSVLTFIGFFLFFASDLVLSFIYFAKNWNRKLYYPNLILYYSGQILIASALFLL